MSVLFRCRVEKALLDKANKVTSQLGTSTAEMFRIFVAQIARTGKVPLKLETDADNPLDSKRRNRVLASLDDSEVPDRKFKMIAIPIIKRLPHDPEWEKTELALARYAAGQLPEPD